MKRSTRYHQKARVPSTGGMASTQKFAKRGVEQMVGIQHTPRALCHQQRDLCLQIQSLLDGLMVRFERCLHSASQTSLAR